MSPEEVTAALESVLAEILPAEISPARRALNAWNSGDLVTAHSLVCDLAWTYWQNEWPMPAQLYPVQDELADRRRAARGAIGRPADHTPPFRLGHIRG